MIHVHVPNLMNCLRELADSEYQRRVWLGAGGNEMSSFTEAYCGAFDDTGLGDAIDADRCPPELDEDSYSALKRLGTAMSKIDDSGPPEALFRDPRMEKVRGLAQAALDLLERRFK